MTATAEISAERIGPYRLVDELGRGGMGVVYRAIHESGSPEVALKMPSRQLAHLFGSVRREIHALGRLRHPGVVRILDEGVEDGVPWYAMEFLRGRSLDKVLNLRSDDYEATADLAPFAIRDGVYAPRAVASKPRVRPDLERALTLMYRLAGVLAHVHARGLVHRDLKPENVLVRAGDHPVLVDFGLVRQFQALSSREVLEVGSFTAGTPLYIAPEQARGDRIDARADLYSFGVMLYEITTGRPPFDSNDANEVRWMHLYDLPLAPSQLVRDVPPALEELILTLLAKKPSDRLGYAEDVAARLVEAGAIADQAEFDAAPYLYRPEVVGRKETIETAHESLALAQSGNGAFLSLGGVSGIGKTSVAAVIARDAAARGIRVVAGEAQPVGGALLQVLRPLLRDIADHCRGNAEATERILGPRLAVLREIEPAFAAFVDHGPALPADVIGRRLFSDLAETLAAYVGRRPLLLILDDLQWADATTVRFLSTLGAEFFTDLPLVILATYRVDEANADLRALVSAPHVSQVPIQRLDDASVGDIVRSMLAAGDVPSAFLEFLATQTEGNPFFVAEYLRSAVAEHVLVRENGRWSVLSKEDKYASLGLPGTIRDLVARRLSRLSPIARRVVDAASVVGREVTEALLFEVSDLRESEVLDAVAELMEEHVFEAAENGVRFAHDKLREAAYEHLDAQRRRELHRRAAEAMERSFASEDERRRHDSELARHFDAAGLSSRAIPHYARAAETALSTGACRESVDLMNRAMALDAEDSGSSEGRNERHAHWQRVLSFAEFGLGNLPASSEHARNSLSALGTELPKTPRGWQMQLVREGLRQGAHVLLPRPFVRSRTKHTVLQDVAMAAQKFSEGRYYTDEKTVMLASGLLAINAAERFDDVAGLIHTYANFGAVAAGLGLNRVARHYYEKARELAAETKDLNGLGHIGYTSAVLYITTCDWKSCQRYCDDAVAAALETGDHQLIEMNLFARGFFELYRGGIASAAATFADVRDRAHKRLNRQHEAWGHSWSAACLILLDRGAQALTAIESALDLVAALGDNAKLVSYAHRCMALYHLGRLDEAVSAADVTFEAVSKIPAIIWEKYRGLSAPAEVYLHAWERIRHDAVTAERMLRATDTLLTRLDHASRRMPLALPVSLRLAGLRQCVEGDRTRGVRLLRKSIAAAVRLGMPIEEGIGEYELARHVDSPRAHLDRARSILEKAGCALYLRKIREWEGA